MNETSQKKTSTYVEHGLLDEVKGIGSGNMVTIGEKWNDSLWRNRWLGR